MPHERSQRPIRFAGVLAALALLSVQAAAGAPPPAETLHRDGPAGPSWGVRVGAVFAQHVGTEERDSEYEVDSEWRTGFTGALFVYWPVTNRFGLQQELVYAQKGSRQLIGVDVLEIPTVLDVTYEMDYLEIPVLTRYVWLRRGRSELYSLAGMAMALKISDHYELSGTVTDGIDTVPIRASADMSEVDMFDFAVVYGLGHEFRTERFGVLVEYRFSMSWNTLPLPTYAYVPFGDEELLIENDPAPLKNQTHSITLGIRF